MKILAALHRFWRASFLEEKTVFVVGLPVLFFFAGHEYSKLSQLTSSPRFYEPKNAEAAKNVRVHVAGAVKKPSLVTLREGARVVDAVRKTGATSEADVNALNLAAPLRDGQKIVIPFRGQKSDRVLDIKTAVIADSPQSSAAKQLSKIVNINTASVMELELLPGLGPAIASRIVAERARKPFISVQDVDRVNGIGLKKLQQIAPYIAF